MAMPQVESINQASQGAPRETPPTLPVRSEAQAPTRAGAEPSAASSSSSRRQRYRPQWEQIAEFKSWLKSVPRDPYKAKCSYCNNTMTADVSVLRNHVASATHLRNAKDIPSQSQKRLETFVASASPTEQRVKEAEIRLCAFLAVHHVPFRAMDHLPQLLGDIFSDSPTAKLLKMRRMKDTCITVKVLGAEGEAQLAAKLRKRPFSIIIDESTDIACVKTLCVVVRFFNEEENTVTSKFWKLLQVFTDAEEADEGATGRHLFAVLMKSFDEAIPNENVIGFASDGANVMTGIFNSVSSRMKEQFPGLTVKTCICHSMHLASSEACKFLPRTCEDLARDIYGYLKASDKRRTQLAGFQDFCEIEVHKILRPAQTRWLSLRDVVRRLLEQWPALQLYFDDQWLAIKLKSAEQIHTSLHNPYLKGYFIFLNWILPKVAGMNELFQSATVVIPIVHQRMTTLFLDILGTYMQRQYVTGTPLSQLQPNREDKFLPINHIYLGVGVMTHLNAPALQSKPADVVTFRTCCRDFLVHLCLGIKQRYDFEDPVMSNLMPLLDPKKATSMAVRDHTAPSLAAYFHLLPRIAPSNKQDPQEIDDEWRSLPRVVASLDTTLPEDTGLFWGALRNLKTSSGMPMFSKLPDYALSALSIPHTNADCERFFSVVNDTKTKKRNRLLTTTVNGILHARQLVPKEGCCFNFTCTPELRSRFTSKIYEKEAEIEEDVDIPD